MVEKGIGVVSIRMIAKGTLLLQETPLITQDEGATGDTIKAALDAIDRDRQREFLALTNSHRGQMNTLLGIFRTNALPCTSPSYVTVSKKPRRYGIFPEAARFNSSCSPNVSFAWHKKLGVLRLYALRDITKGEELCIAYELPLLASRAERWTASESIYSFRCECPTCATVGKSVLESDRIRKELKMRQRASKFIFTDPVGGLRMLRGAFELLEKEGLQILIDGFALDAYQICVELEMYEHAKAYLQQAYEATVTALGVDSDHAERLRAELEEAESWAD